MTLLVTGAMGHVGHAVAAHAARAGLDVVAQYRETFDSARAAALGPRVRWEHCALDDAAALAGLLSRHGVDRCIHCAAISNEAYARPQPFAAIQANVGATAALLDAARAQGWARFILVSTGSVFQLRADLVSPILEDEPPTPGNIYATTKRAAEMLVGMYRREFALSAASVRISWVYGPPVLTDSPTRGPIPSFLMRALRGEAVREDGGDFAASFTYVEDVAEGLLRAALAPDLRHDTYHFGHGRNFTAREAAAAVQAAVPGAVISLGGGTEPWTRYTGLRGPLAGNRFLADIGYAPRHSLAEGIAAYADWMRSLRRGACPPRAPAPGGGTPR